MAINASTQPSYTFNVIGIPKPQGRARVFRNKHTGRVHAVDPETSADWKRTVQAQVLATATRPQHPLAGPLMLGARFYLPMPKSMFRKSSANPYGVPHVKKPDLDNLVKAIKDACKGIVYVDDSQICLYGAVGKYYGPSPGVLFTFTEVG